MEAWLSEFLRGAAGDFSDMPGPSQVGQLIVRMLMAGILGGILGYERERQGKAAGLKTHVLVALTAAFFVATAQQAHLSNSDLSRVIQGLAAGVGFLGAGAILKQSEHGQIIGLTTAANLYLTTAIGIAAGMGRETTAILGTALAYLVLTALYPIQRWAERSKAIEQGVTAACRTEATLVTPSWSGPAPHGPDHPRPDAAAASPAAPSPGAPEPPQAPPPNSGPNPNPRQTKQSGRKRRRG